MKPQKGEKMRISRGEENQYWKSNLRCVRCESMNSVEKLKF